MYDASPILKERRSSQVRSQGQGCAQELEEGTRRTQAEAGAEEERMTCIYTLSDPRDCRVRYVGKANDTYRRLRNHLNTPVSGGMTRWMDELKAIGMRPILIVVERCKVRDWKTMERLWIALYRSTVGDLLNVCDGGDGTTEILAATRTKISVANRGRKNTPEHIEKTRMGTLGRKRTPEQNERNALAHKGRPHSPERCANIAAAAKGRPCSEAHREKISSSLRGRKFSAEHCAMLSAAHARIRARKASPQMTIQF